MSESRAPRDQRTVLVRHRATAHDTTAVPPLFTNVKIVDLQSDQATVSCTTDEPANGAVDYGITTSYAHTSATDPSLVTTHFVLITNLSPAAVYHYRVDGTDAVANSGSSGDLTFQTLAPAPPVTGDWSHSWRPTGPPASRRHQQSAAPRPRHRPSD